MKSHIHLPSVIFAAAVATVLACGPAAAQSKNQYEKRVAHFTERTNKLSASDKPQCNKDAPAINALILNANSALQQNDMKVYNAAEQQIVSKLGAAERRSCFR